MDKESLRMVRTTRWREEVLHEIFDLVEKWNSKMSIPLSLNWAINRSCELGVEALRQETQALLGGVE